MKVIMMKPLKYDDPSSGMKILMSDGEIYIRYTENDWMKNNGDETREIVLRNEELEEAYQDRLMVNKNRKPITLDDMKNWKLA